MALLLLTLPTSLWAQDVISPPSLGQQTQGEAVAESPASAPSTISPKPNDTAQIIDDKPQGVASQLLGTTQISELRRENGRVYRIELEHSSGSKQTIDEFSSDGKFESTDNDIEDAPSLAKWTLGSW